MNGVGLRQERELDGEEGVFLSQGTLGALCDLGCHQIEQFLYWSGAKSARLLHSKVANYRGEHPLFEDYGGATFVADTGATHFFRVDWYTPDGLGAWGDGRTFITVRAVPSSYESIWT